jgi:hypothetical protein
MVSLSVAAALFSTCFSAACIYRRAHDSIMDGNSRYSYYETRHHSLDICFIIRNINILFLPSFIFAGLTREAVLRIRRVDYQQERKRRGFREWAHDVWQLVRNQDNVQAASNMDWAVSWFVRSSISAQGFLAFLLLIGYILLGIRVGFSVILPGAH